MPSSPFLFSKHSNICFAIIFCILTFPLGGFIRNMNILLGDILLIFPIQGWRGDRNTPSHFMPKLEWARAWWRAWHIHADFTSTDRLSCHFAERVLVQNVSHENHLIFMQMTVQVTCIFIPIVSHKDSFCHRGKSKLGFGLFIHELLKEPLILRSFKSVLNLIIDYAVNAPKNLIFLFGFS